MDTRVLERFALWYFKDSRPLTRAERAYLATEIWRLEPAYPVEENLALTDYDLCKRWRIVTSTAALDLA